MIDACYGLDGGRKKSAKEAMGAEMTQSPPAFPLNMFLSLF
jgi:hypothetical protein